MADIAWTCFYPCTTPRPPHTSRRLRLSGRWACGSVHFFRGEKRVAAGIQEALGTGALAYRKAAFEQHDALVHPVPVRAEHVASGISHQVLGRAVVLAHNDAVGAVLLVDPLGDREIHS